MDESSGRPEWLLLYPVDLSTIPEVVSYTMLLLQPLLILALSILLILALSILLILALSILLLLLLKSTTFCCVGGISLYANWNKG